MNSIKTGLYFDNFNNKGLFFILCYNFFLIIKDPT